MDGEMEIVLNNSLNILINVPFCVPQERKSWHEGKWWQSFHFWVSYPCNGGRTAMDVHYTGITSRKHVNPSVMQSESDLKRDLFLPLVFVLFIYRIKSSKEKRGVCFESREMQMSSAEPPRRTRLCIIQKTHTRSRPQREPAIQQTHVEAIQLAVWTRMLLSHQPSVSLPLTSIIGEAKWYVPPENDWETSCLL